MSILIIPEITDKKRTEAKMYQIEERLSKILSRSSIINLFSWSVLAPRDKGVEETILDSLGKGYFALSQTPYFLTFDVIIGFLLREDYKKINTIIFESPTAKEVFEARFKEDTLPMCDDIIVITGEMSIETEVYKRTNINNISGREKDFS